MRQFLTITYTWARRCVVAMIGGTVVLIGVCMIVLPGPAFVVIPAGLAILGIEFACARRWLRQLRTTGTHIFSTTVSRFFTRRSKADNYVRGSEKSHDRLHAIPPFARGQLAVEQSRHVKANTKTSYSQSL